MFKKIVAAFLAIVPFLACSQDYVPAERLLSSRFNEQISDGYLQCSSVLTVLGMAASDTHPEEGAGYFNKSSKYVNLYMIANNAQLSDVQVAKVKFHQAVSDIVRNPSRRDLFLNDIKFCLKWIDTK